MSRNSAVCKKCASSAALSVVVLLGGCVQPYSGDCTRQQLVMPGELQGDAHYHLKTTGGTQFSMYPGQQVTVPVLVAPVDGATGKVVITALGMPSGLTMPPTPATIGSTVNLVFTSNTALATECFRAQTEIFTASTTLALHAEGDTGSKDLGLDLDIVLQNPNFVPTTTTLPVLTISTAGGAPIVSEDDYLAASMTIKSSVSSNNYSGTMQIKGHGHTTWLMPKQPWRLKLDNKSKLLGMPSEKNWILLANYDDKTMLRDALASEISNITGLPWAPRSQFVEVMLNGQYQGVYQLIENVDINSSRLNIADSDTNTADPTANGYLMEIDQREDDTYHWITPHGIYVESDDPDPPTPAEETYLYNGVNQAEATFYSPVPKAPTSDWRAAWNESSVINFFIVNELMGNQDGPAFSSDYFYKDAGATPWFMGPVWDFDISSGNDNYGAILDPNVPWMSTGHPWYRQLFTDPTFLADVKAQWTAIRPMIGTLPAYIDAQAAALAQPAANNYARWPTLHQRVWPNAVAEGSYQAEVDYLKTWLAARTAYMDAHYLNP